MSGSCPVNLSFSDLVVIEKRFSNDLTLFLYSCNYLPFEEDLALYLNEFEFSLPKDDLCQVSLKLAWWFWRRFLYKKKISVFLLFRYYLSLGKRVGLHMNNFESLSPKADLCQLWLQLANRFWRRSSNRQTNGRTPAVRRTTDDQKSSLELSAQVS
jgi:hypothetical protein